MLFLLTLLRGLARIRGSSKRGGPGTLSPSMLRAWEVNLSEGREVEVDDLAAPEAWELSSSTGSDVLLVADAP